MCPRAEICFGEATWPSSTEPYAAGTADSGGEFLAVRLRPVVGVEYLVVLQSQILGRTGVEFRAQF